MEHPKDISSSSNANSPPDKWMAVCSAYELAVPMSGQAPSAAQTTWPHMWVTAFAAPQSPLHRASRQAAHTGTPWRPATYPARSRPRLIHTVGVGSARRVATCPWPPTCAHQWIPCHELTATLAAALRRRNLLRPFKLFPLCSCALQVRTCTSGRSLTATLATASSAPMSKSSCEQF